MARVVGTREASLRQMREEGSKKRTAAVVEFCIYPRCKCIASTSTGQPDVECPLGRPPGPPAEQKAQAKPAPQSKKESKLSKAKPVRTAAKAKAKAKPVPKKSAKAGVDRSPLAVGNFIVAGGTDGVTMAQLVEKFDMEAHPMRSKIFTARHTLKFNIKHDDKNGRYIGKAPAQKKTAPPKIAKAA